MLKKIHFWIGVIGLISFLLSGQYFRHALGGLQGLENSPRLLLRTSHIYLLLTSFINYIFGLYYVQPKQLKWYTILNQSFIMLSPFLIAYGFVFETLSNEGIDRPKGSIGLIFIFLWLANTTMGKVYGLIKFNKQLQPTTDTPAE